MITCNICKQNNFEDKVNCFKCGRTLIKPIQGGSVSTKPVPSVRKITSEMSNTSSQIQSSSIGSCKYHPALPALYLGSCKYHPALPALYICNRCGRQICRDCSKPYLNLVLCPHCYSRVMPYHSPIYQPYVTYQ